MNVTKNKPLGRIERVDLKTVWTNEAGDFTPWLAQEENLGLLGNTIGIDLELEAMEKEVGPFRADILCKDTATNNWVVIENQLEKTDHSHLGQILTYAAGLKAVTIVWIAKRFTEEHRATLDWLNEITDSRFNFFGIEVELWHIGKSPNAPKFNIVSKPNDWTKTAAAPRAFTPTQSLQRDFWTAFREYVKDKNSNLKTAKPFYHYMSIAVGKGGINLAAVIFIQKKELRVELGLSDDKSKSYVEQLDAEKEQIEKEIGEPLTWHVPSEAQQCRIYLRKSADISDTNQWQEQHEWLLEKLEVFYKVFAPRVKRLKAS